MKSEHGNDFLRRLERFEQEVAELCALIRIPGLSAGIVHNQRLVWAQGFGFRDYEQRLPATPDTVYPIHSVTKTFSSVLTMHLVESDKLDLNTPIKRYIPGYDGHDATTVRHLLTHTSHGIPGERFRYDGNRFNLLTAVIEQVTKKPFAAALSEIILEPLAMRRTTGPDASGYVTILDEVTKLYVLEDNSLAARPINGHFYLGASGILFSTVPDLARYDQALDQHVLLKEDSQEHVFLSSVSHTGKVLPYGLGWFVQHYQGVKLVWHYGIGPTSSLLLKIPERNLTLILLANSDGICSYKLHYGDVLKCPFVGPFLRLFVLGNTDNASLTPLDWNVDLEVLPVELDRRELQMSTYRYADEVLSRGLINFWHIGNRQRNIDLLRLATRRYPDSSAVNHVAILDYLTASGDPELQQAGERVALRLLQNDPDNTEIMLGLALLYHNAARPELRSQAYPWFERIIQRQERAGQRELAWSGYVLGKYLLGRNPARAKTYLELAHATGYESEDVLDQTDELLQALRHSST
jgi:CubicO group peptidase (beta-lactamase class C family)